MFFWVLISTSTVALTQVAQTSRADYYVSHLSLRINARQCDAVVAQTEKLLDVHAAHFRYERMLSVDEVQTTTGRKYVSGWAVEDKIVSVEPCSRHEIVHVVAFKLGLPEMFYHEGLAINVAGESNRKSRESARKTALKEQIGIAKAEGMMYDFDVKDNLPKTLVPLAYNLADGFAHFLIEKYGLWRMRLFFRSCSAYADTPQAFKSAYGMTREEAWSLWLNDGKVPSR